MLWGYCLSTQDYCFKWPHQNQSSLRSYKSQWLGWGKIHSIFPLTCNWNLAFAFPLIMKETTNDRSINSTCDFATNKTTNIFTLCDNSVKRKRKKFFHFPHTGPACSWQNFNIVYIWYNSYTSYTWISYHTALSLQYWTPMLVL